MQLKINKKVAFALQYAIAFTIIAVILLRIDIGKLGGTLHKVAWWTIPVLFSATIIAMTIQGLRWWLLLRAFSDKIPLSRGLAYHFSSVFYSMILPTSAAQEVVRTLFVLQKVGPAVSWGAAWIGKITAVLISMVFSTYGLLYLTNATLPRGTLIGSMVFFLIVVLAIIFSFSKNFTTPVRRLLSFFVPKRWLIKIENIREGVYQYRSKKKSLLITIVLTSLFQLLFVLNLSLVIKGICGKFFFWECLAFIPLIEIVSMSVPLTPNGMGIREALTALMFQHLGLSDAQLGTYIVLTLSSNLLRLTGAVPIIHGLIKKRNRLRVIAANKL